MGILSGMVFDYEPKNEWKARHYWHFLYRKEINKEVYNARKRIKIELAFLDQLN